MQRPRSHWTPHGEGLTILVTDARLKQSLGLAWSLGRRGYEVAAAGIAPRCQTHHSRYCTHRVNCINPNRDPEGYVRDLRDAITSLDVDVLLPCSDAAVVPIARHRELLDPVVGLPLPPTEAVLATHEKWDFHREARTAGVPVPRTERPASPREAESLAAEFDGPVVVKPGQSSGSDGVSIGHTPAEARTAYETARSGSTAVFDHSRPLLQEYVPGSVHDACLLYEGGELEASMTQRRVWTYPIDGGSGALVRTTDEPDLVDLSRRLLARLGWTEGVAEVEFRVDDETGEPVLIEVNPRIWGIVDAAIAAGVDFPGMLCDVATDRAVDPPTDYEVGLEFVWFDEELAEHLWHAPDRGRRLLSLARRLPAVETNVSIRDPLPHLVRWFDLADDAGRRLLVSGRDRLTGR